jgi:hypothetical protein
MAVRDRQLIEERLNEWYPLWNDRNQPPAKVRVLKDEVKTFPDQDCGEGTFFTTHEIVKEILCPICKELREISHMYEGPSDYDGIDSAVQDFYELTCGGLCDDCLVDFHQLLVKKGMVDLDNRIFSCHRHDAQGRCMIEYDRDDEEQKQQQHKCD